MDLPLYSMFDPFSPTYETYEPNHCTSLSQLQPQNNEILPARLPLPADDDLDNLLHQFPTLRDNHEGVTQHNNVVNRRKAPLVLDDDVETNGVNPNDRKKKQKIVHREIERQRRSEMASLHKSLRSLLPHDCIKGKRAMSDHLGEAVKYIKYLQQNLKVLRHKRDALKKEVYANPTTRDRDVKVTPCKGGVDVLVTTKNGGGANDEEAEAVPLSELLRCLTQEGLDVVSCIFNKDDTKLIHSIHAQVGEGKNVAIDAIKLQQKLEDI